MKRYSMSIPRTAAAGALAGMLALTGCSSDTSAATGPSSGKPNQNSAAAVAAATAAVESAVKGIGGPVPTTGPPAAAGKKVWVISAFEQVPNLSSLTRQAREAGKELGWKTSVCDGRNNANGAWAGCVRQAVAAKADGIVLESVDCAPVKAALGEAKQAGIKIVGLTAFDCDDPTQGGGKAMFDASASFVSSVPSTAEFFRQQGKLRADWLIAKSQGKAKVLHVAFRGVALGEYLAEGFEKEMATCSGCTVAGTVDITPQDVPQIRQKFESALTKLPQVDAVAVDVDFMATAGIQAALVSANRPGLSVAGGECSLDSLGYVREGKGVQMCIGSSLGRQAYAAVDALNRVFAHAAPAPSGLGWQVVTRDDNLPKAGEGYEDPTEYRAGFRALWKS
ncbi:substrate-binding domain-containing protein [Streptomyces sp. DG2A-72]|uniref:sugar ABC transporter substrate-binding protein n=1 Tax=Streptomyces sp. DG2A-72 TaxID=3051386 RepID=UPI00265C2F8D|nr:substrate-binding domain-containing protein [Streptomyces sp. DG2A-72]MDO0930721.1 substrate-binding domain-containing protein [Streptomyces sp. DG2A-72]